MGLKVDIYFDNTNISKIFFAKTANFHRFMGDNLKIIIYLQPITTYYSVLTYFILE